MGKEIYGESGKLKGDTNVGGVLKPQKKRHRGRVKEGNTETWGRKEASEGKRKKGGLLGRM